MESSHFGKQSAIPQKVKHKEMKIHVHIKTCTQMFITTLFIIAKNWKQPRCLATDEWIKKYIVCSYNGILFGYKNE